MEIMSLLFKMDKLLLVTIGKRYILMITLKFLKDMF